MDDDDDVEGMRSPQFCEEWQEAHDECIEMVGALGKAVLELLVQEVGLKANSLDDIHRSNELDICWAMTV